MDKTIYSLSATHFTNAGNKKYAVDDLFRCSSPCTCSGGKQIAIINDNYGIVFYALRNTPALTSLDLPFSGSIPVTDRYFMNT